MCNKYIQDSSDCDVTLVYLRADRSVSFRIRLPGWCCTFGPCTVSSSFSDTVIFTDISLRMVPGISPFLPRAVACRPAPCWLPASWIGPDQHSVFNTVNEGSEGQNFSVHADIWYILIQHSLQIHVEHTAAVRSLVWCGFSLDVQNSIA